MDMSAQLLRVVCCRWCGKWVWDWTESKRWREI